MPEITFSGTDRPIDGEAWKISVSGWKKNGLIERIERIECIS